MQLKYTVKPTDNYQTINEILTNEFQISTRLLSKIKKNQQTYLNGILADTRSLIKPSDNIMVDLSATEDNSNIVPTEMPLEIIYEDEWLLVINKPAGIATHPSAYHFDDSLSNGVRFYFDSIKKKKKIRPINRLDLNTSGLVVFAKCEYIQECLSKQMAENRVKKEYLCLAQGIFNKKNDTINLPISRKPNSIIERCISANGQPSITDYEVLEQFDSYSFIKCNLKTGRTHQIRVHMSYIGHALLGDTLYGCSSDLINRQALHCYHLQFHHPINKKDLDFICPLPQDFKNLLQK